MARGACIMEASPEFSGMIGMARILNEKFPKIEGESAEVRAEKMRRYFARRLQYNVILHEMGHSFSLRHNFLSSYDAISFRPQYWQLRTRNGTVTEPCTEAQNEEGAKNCVGPRYFDPVTQEETDGLIWMWQQSSVMDYAGDLSVDTMSLGAYDFAATRMFYGESTSVFTGDKEIPGSDVNAGWVIDTDKDGVADKVEELLGSNPNDPKSRPSKALINQNAQVIQASSGIVGDFAERMDGFGGILGLQTGSDHYSRHQAKYNLMRADTCVDVDPNSFRPSDWKDNIDGAYHPTLDARIVAVDGAYKRCKQQPVDYVNWSDLRPVFSEVDANAVQGDNPPAADPQGRLRVPYPFASDGWADSGNVSVYRHDQGADTYELFMFLLGSQENRHILDNYRRNRVTFSIRGSMNRSFDRYTQKVMRAVKGLGLFNNLYETLGLSSSWRGLLSSEYAENAIAASMAMDHFARQLTRPQDGEHYLLQQPDGTELMMASDGAFLTPLAATPHITIPNGSAGYVQNGFNAFGFGGRPINNSLDRTKGDYASSYQLGVGSYYDKINAVMALTESQDNFISSSRGDFVDARYRATSVADVFSDGFRRLIGAALANDKTALGPRVAGTKSQFPTYTTSSDLIDKIEKNQEVCAKDSSQCVLGEDGTSAFPKQPMAWTSWWPAAGPQACWSTNGTQVCQTFAGNKNGFDVNVPSDSLVIDPELGWEVQKYIIGWTYLYLPENSRTDWFDMLRIYRSYDVPDILGAKVQWRDPFTGTIYVARSFGTETVNGKVVQKGIGARVLQRANELTALSFENDGINPETGEVQLKLDASGNPILAGGSNCGDIGTCIELKQYKSIPDFMVQAAMAYGLTEGQTPKGIYLAEPRSLPSPREGVPCPPPVSGRGVSLLKPPLHPHSGLHPQPRQRVRHPPAIHHEALPVQRDQRRPSPEPGPPPAHRPGRHHRRPQRVVRPRRRAIRGKPSPPALQTPHRRHRAARQLPPSSLPPPLHQAPAPLHLAPPQRHRHLPPLEPSTLLRRPGPSPSHTPPRPLAPVTKPRQHQQRHPRRQPHPQPSPQRQQPAPRRRRWRNEGSRNNLPGGSRRGQRARRGGRGRLLVQEQGEADGERVREPPAGALLGGQLALAAARAADPDTGAVPLRVALQQHVDPQWRDVRLAVAELAHAGREDLIVGAGQRVGAAGDGEASATDLRPQRGGGAGSHQGPRPERPGPAHFFRSKRAATATPASRSSPTSTTATRPRAAGEAGAAAGSGANRRGATSTGKPWGSGAASGADSGAGAPGAAEDGAP